MANTAIQVTLHSNGANPNAVGITSDGALVQNNRFISPSHSKVIRYYDDFIGDTLRAEWNSQVGSDSSNVLAAAVNNQIGGVARMVTGASGTTTMAVNGVSLAQGAFLNWKAAIGGLLWQSRVKSDVVTSLAFYNGFTDQDSAVEMPFTLSTGTLTSNCSDGCGFLFDTAATAATIKCVGTKGDTDATVYDTGIALVAATWIDLGIQVDSGGTARFFINGALVATMVNALTTTVALTPSSAGFARTSTIRNLDIDYINLEMHRV